MTDPKGSDSPGRAVGDTSPQPAEDPRADSLAGSFLVAMPALDDAHFSRTVTLICEHNEDGALGLVVNRPSDITLADMLDHLGAEHDPDVMGDTPVYWGGPVQPERGFVLHGLDASHDWEATVPLGDGLAVTSSRDILDAIGAGTGPGDFLITLGYAGWDAGQLDDEVLGNAWLSVPNDCAILFQTPAPDRWEAAVHLLGIEVGTLSSVAGHG